MKIQIIGSGSAGMHWLRAASLLKKDIQIAIGDTSEQAIETLPARYQARYGEPLPDAGLSMDLMDCDYLVIATPPASHLAIAQAALPKVREAIVMEKPVCAPGQENALGELVKSLGEVRAYVNYQYLLHPIMGWLRHEMPGVSDPIIAHVYWQEHLSFMERAHPWIKSSDPWYIRDVANGGGAANEHSHGLALLINCVLASLGSNRLMTASSKCAQNGHDQYSHFTLAVETPDGNYLGGGTATLDFMSRTPIKRLEIHAPECSAFVTWNGAEQSAEIQMGDGKVKSERMTVTREQEFLNSLRHIMDASLYEDSGISLKNVLPIQEILSGHYKDILVPKQVH